MKKNGFAFLGFFILLLLSGLSSCNNKLNKNEVSPAVIPSTLPRFVTALQPIDTMVENLDTLLFFKRSACFGSCPAYDYIIYTNGLVVYRGHQHAQPTGKHFALIQESEWKEIMALAGTNKFFELADIYPIEKEMYIPDLPNTTTLIKDAGLRKQVIDNHSCPKELKNFEIFLEEKIKSFSFKPDWSNSEK